MACLATLKRSMDFDPLMNQNSPKRRRCVPVSPSASPQKYLRLEPSPFSQVNPNPLSTEQILHNIKQEYKRMQKRRHLENNVSETGVDPQPSASISGMCVGSSPTKRDQPLLTLRQVGLICERLVKEREEKVREEYEEILTAKLAGSALCFSFIEQYDTFVKFTHDQLMRRFGEQPASYVS